MAEREPAEVGRVRVTRSGWHGAVGTATEAVRLDPAVTSVEVPSPSLGAVLQPLLQPPGRTAVLRNESCQPWAA